MPNFALTPAQSAQQALDSGRRGFDYMESVQAERQRRASEAQRMQIERQEEGRRELAFEPEQARRYIENDGLSIGNKQDRLDYETDRTAQSDELARRAAEASLLRGQARSALTGANVDEKSELTRIEKERIENRLGMSELAGSNLSNGQKAFDLKLDRRSEPFEFARRASVAATAGSNATGAAADAAVATGTVDSRIADSALDVQNGQASLMGTRIGNDQAALDLGVAQETRASRVLAIRAQTEQALAELAGTRTKNADAALDYGVRLQTRGDEVTRLRALSAEAVANAAGTLVDNDTRALALQVAQETIDAEIARIEAGADSAVAGATVDGVAAGVALATQDTQVDTAKGEAERIALQNRVTAAAAKLAEGTVDGDVVAGNAESATAAAQSMADFARLPAEELVKKQELLVELTNAKYEQQLNILKEDRFNDQATQQIGEDRLASEAILASLALKSSQANATRFLRESEIFYVDEDKVKETRIVDGYLRAFDANGAMMPEDDSDEPWGIPMESHMQAYEAGLPLNAEDRELANKIALEDAKTDGALARDDATAARDKAAKGINPATGMTPEQETDALRESSEYIVEQLVTELSPAQDRQYANWIAGQLKPTDNPAELLAKVEANIERGVDRAIESNWLTRRQRNFLDPDVPDGLPVPAGTKIDPKLHRRPTRAEARTALIKRTINQTPAR